MKQTKHRVGGALRWEMIIVQQMLALFAHSFNPTGTLVERLTCESRKHGDDKISSVCSCSIAVARLFTDHMACTNAIQFALRSAVAR